MTETKKSTTVIESNPSFPEHVTPLIKNAGGAVLSLGDTTIIDPTTNRPKIQAVGGWSTSTYGHDRILAQNGHKSYAGEIALLSESKQSLPGILTAFDPSLSLNDAVKNIQSIHINNDSETRVCDLPTFIEILKIIEEKLLVNPDDHISNDVLNSLSDKNILIPYPTAQGIYPTLNIYYGSKPGGGSGIFITLEEKNDEKLRSSNHFLPTMIVPKKLPQSMIIEATPPRDNERSNNKDLEELIANHAEGIYIRQFQLIHLLAKRVEGSIHCRYAETFDLGENNLWKAVNKDASETMASGMLVIDNNLIDLKTSDKEPLINGKVRASKTNNMIIISGPSAQEINKVHSRTKNSNVMCVVFQDESKSEAMWNLLREGQITTSDIGRILLTQGLEGVGQLNNVGSRRNQMLAKTQLINVLSKGFFNGVPIETTEISGVPTRLIRNLTMMIEDV